MRRIICLLFCAVVALCPIKTLFAQGTAFTYQGLINDGGSLANSNYDLTFSIFGTNTGGSTVAGPITTNAIPVTNGLFTVTLDFGAGVFTGQNRWLEIAVRATGVTNFTTLSPRQRLTPVPYAIFANSASNLTGSLVATQLSGTLPSAQLSGTYSGLVIFTNGGNSFTGTISGNGAGLTNLNASQLTGGTVADARLSTNVALLNRNQTFTGSNTYTGSNFFSGANTFTNRGNSFAGSFFGNGHVGWIPTNGTAVQAIIDTGYLLTNSQLVTVTLPASPSIGDIVRVSGAGASGWQIAQIAGQSVLGNFSSFARSYWTPSGASALHWSSIASSVDGSHLAAVAGSAGNIYTSSDSGINWSSQDSARDWRCIATSADGTKLAAVVYGGGIYTNSGTSWAASGASSANWVSIASSADGSKLVAAVSGGYIYTSSNSGGTWTQRDSSRNWSSVASSADGSKLVAAVNVGRIYTSVNSGVNWTQQAGSSSASWTSVASSSDGSKLVATVNGGGIYTSTDSGGTWTQRTNAPNASWTSVASSSDGGKLAATVNGGRIYTSSNFGITWAQQTNAPAKNWSSIASSSDGGKLAAAINSTTSGGIYVSQASPQITTTTTGTAGFITGSQGSAVELQYIGGGQFMPVSYAGTIWAY